jgi:hypothetical protein
MRQARRVLWLPLSWRRLGCAVAGRMAEIFRVAAGEVASKLRDAAEAVSSVREARCDETCAAARRL